MTSKKTDKNFKKKDSEEFKITAKEFINYICNINKWESNKILEKNLINYLRIETNFEIERNKKLLNNLQAMSYKRFPTGEKELRLLIEAWQRERESTDLGKLSTQVASTVRGLRKKGFVFKSDSNGAKYTIKNDNNIVCRIITGLDMEQCKEESSYVKISKELRKLYYSVYFEDIIFGNRPASDLQIDHRYPIHIRRSGTVDLIDFDLETLKSGEHLSQFQPLAKPTNCRKREACGRCEKGECIPLPLCIKLFARAYITKQNETGPKCKGCFWFNFLDPLHPELLPDLDSFLKIYKEKEKKLQKLVKEYELNKKNKKRKKKKCQNPDENIEEIEKLMTIQNLT